MELDEFLAAVEADIICAVFLRRQPDRSLAPYEHPMGFYKSRLI
jgi:hypothetical protein